VFQTLEPQPPEGLMATMAAFAADTDPAKLDLGVGVYRDESGTTPVMAAVRAAEARLLAAQTTKAYVGFGGNRPFAAFVEALVLGDQHPARAAGRVVTLQTPGGCGALKLAADLVVKTGKGSRAVVSDPTWPNHGPLFSGAGLSVDTYPYYDAPSGTIDFDAMLSTLDRLASGSVVVLHGACHNPTGADLSTEQWRAVAELLARRGLLPLVDLAYQGLGDGLDADAAPVRMLAERLPEVLIAASCSKNFGLYRERTGVLGVVCDTPAQADAAMSQLVRLARGLWSMPPDHGAAIVHGVLTDPELRAQWIAELDGMRRRVQGLRHEVVRHLVEHCPGRDFGFIARHHGMFSLFGISTAQVRELRSQHHVYMIDDSRMNVAGLRRENLEYFARSVGAVLAAGAGGGG